MELVSLMDAIQMPSLSFFKEILILVLVLVLVLHRNEEIGAMSMSS
jgi:uncharacterized membrane protein